MKHQHFMITKERRKNDETKNLPGRAGRLRRAAPVGRSVAHMAE
jgi:hypothetical protein